MQEQGYLKIDKQEFDYWDKRLQAERNTKRFFLFWTRNKNVSEKLTDTDTLF